VLEQDKNKRKLEIKWEKQESKYLAICFIVCHNLTRKQLGVRSGKDKYVTIALN
jgi:hypothetical protein